MGLDRLVSLWDEDHWKSQERRKKKILQACCEKSLREGLMAFPPTVPFSGVCDLCGRTARGLNRVCYQCLREE